MYGVVAVRGEGSCFQYSAYICIHSVVVLYSAEEKYVHTDSVNTQPDVSHVLSRKACDGSWKYGFSQCSDSYDFSSGQSSLWDWWLDFVLLVYPSFWTSLSLSGNMDADVLNAGITRVFYGSNFVTVTKSDDASWDFLKPEIFAAIMDFYSSGQPLFLDSKTAAAMDTAIQEV